MADPPGVTVPLWLVNAAKFASWVAVCSLIYFLWLYTLDIARDRAGAMHITHAGVWQGDIRFWFPYIVGFAIVAFGIPYVAKIAIPTFMSLTWRGNFWPKLWALVIALAVSLVVVAGTFTVQGDTIMERERGGAVAVAQVEQERAVHAARIADVQHRLDEMTRSPNIYVQTAASMSPTAYEAWMEARRGDWQYERFVAYRETSAEAERLRNQLSELRAQQAAMTVNAQVQETVVTERTDWIADTLAWLEGVRAILLSLVMDIVALMMPWIALRLEQARNRQLGMADGIAPHPWMLKDMSTPDKAGYVSPAEMKERAAPMDAAYKGDVIYDEQGREMRWVEGFVRDKDRKWIPGHYRLTGARKKQEIEVTYNDKTFRTSGSKHDDSAAPVDGAKREASTASEPAMEGGGEDAPSARVVTPDDGGDNAPPVEDAPILHPEPPIELPDLTEDIEAELAAEDADAPVAPDAVPHDETSERKDRPDDHIDLPDNEGVMQQHDDEPEPQPETRPERLLEPAK